MFYTLVFANQSNQSKKNIKKIKHILIKNMYDFLFGDPQELKRGNHILIISIFSNYGEVKSSFLCYVSIIFFFMLFFIIIFSFLFFVFIIFYFSFLWAFSNNCSLFFFWFFTCMCVCFSHMPNSSLLLFIINYYLYVIYYIRHTHLF